MASTAPQNTTADKNKVHPVKKFFRKVLWYFLLLLLLAGIGTYIYCNYTYSEGSRAGLLLKFSYKGFIKTYEGELNLGGINPIPGNTLANNIWKFSVRNDSIAKKLMGLEGKNLRLHYKEKVKSFFWQGETNYFVDEVEEVK